MFRMMLLIVLCYAWLDDKSVSLAHLHTQKTHMNSKVELVFILKILYHCPQSLCVCVCLCVFIKLHITTQSGPVILVILCHSH